MKWCVGIQLDRSVSISYFFIVYSLSLSYYRLPVWLWWDRMRYWLVCLCCFVFYSQPASRVVRYGSVQVVVYLARHVVCSNTLCHCTFIEIELHQYRGSPTYPVFTTTDPTTAIFGLYTRKWGIFALIGDYCKFRVTQFFPSQVFDGNILKSDVKN